MTSSRRAWLVWSVGLAAYVVAVLQRTSLGVAGIDATQRFDASASVLASFAVLQLLVYAGLQVPVGLLLDRWGPKRLIIVGAFLMSAGQLVLALSTGVGVAVLGRVLVGAGDAMTFISVLRLVNAWLPPPRIPVFTQVTGIAGQAGQILSAIPLVALLHGPGWTPAFLSAAALGVIIGIVVLLVVQDSPSGPIARHDAPGWGKVGADLRSAWAHPGTRLGLWTHFTTQFSGTVFALLWGFPFLVSGEGVSRRTASTLLTVFVLAGMVAAPFLGVLVERHPLRRSWLVLSIIGINVVMWTVVLTWPGQAPIWLLTLLVLSLALGGPGSMIAFDYARTFNPPNRLGTATGIVNVGGFVASLLTMLMVGVVLDLLSTGGASSYSLGDFRVALAAQYVIWGVGVLGIVGTRRRVRARLAQEGVVVPPMREALARRRAGRKQ
ncbi:MAG: MFS transporter [Actinomycetes bacterium]